MIEGDLVVHELLLRAAIQDVFSMFIDPVKLTRWIGIEAQLEPHPGGRFRFEVAPGQFCEGEYIEVAPPARLVFTWGWSDPAIGLPPGSSRVEITLAEADGGTRLRLVHSQLQGNLTLMHDEGWTRFLNRLASVVTGIDPDSYPSGDLRARLSELHGGPQQ